MSQSALNPWILQHLGSHLQHFPQLSCHLREQVQTELRQDHISISYKKGYMKYQEIAPQGSVRGRARDMHH